MRLRRSRGSGLGADARLWPVGAFVMAVAGATPAWALPDEQPELILGSGDRHLQEDEPPPRAPAEPPASLEPEKVAPPAKPTHQGGKVPKVPSPTLPESSPLPAASESARLAISGGAPRGSSIAASPELRALREAEEALFPTALPGLTPGWSWDVPTEVATDVDARTSTRFDAADTAWLASLTMPDLPVRLDRRVVTYLKFYRDSERGRTIVAIWSKTSGRYVSSIQTALRRAGLPADLVWLSMIESGHNPTIASPAGALGLWQFMPESARAYGLTVDRWVDERRDPARATQAAIKFLGDLHARFGSWELAMAAYNMGHAGLSKSISKFNTNDYFTLSKLEGGIPWETTLYVPKIFALAIVMNNREAFGLRRPPETTPEVPFETILVAPGTALADVAKVAEVPIDELRARNLRYAADRTPPDPGKRYPLLVPPGKGAKVLAQLEGKGGVRRETHRVRVGEDFTTLAADTQISTKLWLRENGFEAPGELQPGTWLFVPKGAKFEHRRGTPFVAPRSIEVPKGHRMVVYEVRPGDELASIAASFGVEVRDLCRVSAIDPAAKLREGMSLAVLVPSDRDLSLVRHLDASEATILVAGSPEFHEFFEGQKGLSRVEVVAGEGDTLATIGKRYGMTVGSMERVNRRSRGSKLVAGETLVVYTSQAKAGDSPLASPEPLPALAPPRPELLGEAPR